ncbi:MAG: heme NO-binding domain-containing protein [Agarilytica sp.]
MKGVVFIAINDMVEKEFGISVWEEILSEVNPKCQGVYTSTQEYPDEDVVKYVLTISQKLGVEPSVATQYFGKFLFGELNKKYGIFTKLSPNLFDFLRSIEGVIHKEVRKLYDTPSLPTLDYHTNNKHDLQLKYSSPRKLCFLAEGLIFGAAEFYGEDIILKHDTCTHKGDDHCLLRVIRRE